MSAIDKYFNYFNDKLNESHKLDIINMYNNIQTYDYHDIFDTDMSFNTINMKSNKKKFTLLKPKFPGSIKGTVISSNQTKIYKVYIFQNDKNKDYFVINALREFYFQNKFREHFINNNIENIIIPEIYRYGIINIKTNNEILFFAEMKYYGENNLYKIIKQQQTGTQRLEKINDYANKLKDVRNVIRGVEEQLQIYHGDILSIRHLQNSIRKVTEAIAQEKYKHERYWADFESIISHENIFFSNNKFIFIDFETCSIIDFDNISTEHINTRKGFMQPILNELYFDV